jgi:hypothetical protein
MNFLMVKALGMTAAGFQQTGDSGFCHFCQSRSGSDTASFVEVVKDRLGFRFAHFGVEQSRMASFRKFVMATTATQQTNAIFTVDLTNAQIALAWAAIMLAIGIDTG